MTLTSLPHHFTSDDIRRASTADPSGRPFTIVRGAVVAAGVAAAVGWGVAEFGLTPLHGAGADWTVRAAEAGWIGFAVLVAIQIWFGRKWDAMVGEVAARPDQTAIFDEEGLRLVGRWGETTTRWEGIARAEWRGDDLLLISPDGTRHMLPARAMPDAAWRAALAALVARKVGGSAG